MDKDQRDFLARKLHPGLAVAKTTRYEDPFLITVPFVPFPLDVSDDEVLEQLSLEVDALYRPVEAAQVREAIRTHRGIPAEAVAMLPPRNTRGVPPEHSSDQESGPGLSKASAKGKSPGGMGRGRSGNRHTKSTAGHDSGTSSLSDRARRVCMVWLNLEYPFLTEGEIFAKAGVTAGSAKAQIKKELVRLEMIITHELQCGKGRMNVWEPVGKLWDELE